MRKRGEKRGNNTSIQPGMMDRSQEEEKGGWKQEIWVMEGAERIKIKNGGQRQKDRGEGEPRVSDMKPLPGAPVSSWASYLLRNLIRSLILMPIGQLHN